MAASRIFPLAFIFAAALFDNSLQARQSLRTGEDIHRGVPWNWRAKARMTFRRPFLRPVGVEPTTFSSGGQRSIQLSYGREWNRKITQFSDLAIH